MYCTKCGTKADEYSKFCASCGKNLKNNKSDRLSQPYIISISKLIILSITTFGLFEIYWFYRQFKSFKYENRWEVFPLVRAIFAGLTSYSLFKHVSNETKKINKDKQISAGWLAISFFIINTLWRLPDPYWWVASLTFLPVIPVQNLINYYWEKKHNNTKKSSFGGWNYFVTIIGGVILLLALVGTDYSGVTKSTSPNSSFQNANNTSLNSYSQEEISSSVVNIFCPSIISEEDSSGGSGVILTEDGIILTNSHIIPQDEDELLINETGCLVVLPDPTTGQPSEVYLADPIVLQGISDTYDLAYMQIYDAYYDEEIGEYQGTYPNTFPAFDDTTRCSNEDLKLGEFVRIYGYPAISGGYSLTVTDGTVSSFPGGGLIITSAKISKGNSGGIAVDRNGCMIGVPSLVSTDENESLGVIYSMDLVHEFYREVQRYLDELE